MTIEDSKGGNVEHRTRGAPTRQHTVYKQQCTTGSETHQSYPEATPGRPPKARCKRVSEGGKVGVLYPEILFLGQWGLEEANFCCFERTLCHKPPRLSTGRVFRYSIFPPLLSSMAMFMSPRSMRAAHTQNITRVRGDGRRPGPYLRVLYCSQSVFPASVWLRPKT